MAHAEGSPKERSSVSGLRLWMTDQQPTDENLAPARFLSCLSGAIADSIFESF